MAKMIHRINDNEVENICFTTTQGHKSQYGYKGSILSIHDNWKKDDKNDFNVRK